MSDETYSMTAGGGAVKRHQTLLSEVRDEHIFQIEDGRIEVKTVDPANVLMGYFTLDPAITGEAFDTDAAVQFGVNNRVYRRAIGPAYKGQGSNHGDPVGMEYNHDRRRVFWTVNGDRDDYEIEHTTKAMSIDPDAMRGDVTEPNLDLSAKARLPRDAFVEATKTVSNEYSVKYANITADGSDLLITAADDTEDYDATLPGVVEGGDAIDGGSLLSDDYLRSIRSVVKKTKPDHVTVKFDNEFPVRFEMEWPELGLEARYAIAPRVQRD